MENLIKFVTFFASAKEVIDGFIAKDSIQSFVIGKTDSIENRQNDERYKGYQLYKIGEDSPDVINSLEKALILLSNVSEPYKSLHEKQIDGGGGNPNADKLYVAIKIKL